MDGISRVRKGIRISRLVAKCSESICSIASWRSEIATRKVLLGISESAFCIVRKALTLLQCLDVEELAGNAIVLWEDTTKHFKTSYLAWTAYTEVLMYVLRFTALVSSSF